MSDTRPYRVSPTPSPGVLTEQLNRIFDRIQADIKVAAGIGTSTPSPATLDALATQVQTLQNQIRPMMVQQGTVAQGAVGTTQIQDGAVTTPQIGAAAVTATQLASGAVGTVAIAAGAVGTTELADDSVTTVKIVDANVTTIKIADANVTAAKIAAGIFVPGLSDVPTQPGAPISLPGGSLTNVYTPTLTVPVALPKGYVRFSVTASLFWSINPTGLTLTADDGNGNTLTLNVQLLPVGVTDVYSVVVSLPAAAIAAGTLSPKFGFTPTGGTGGAYGAKSIAVAEIVWSQ